MTEARPPRAPALAVPSPPPTLAGRPDRPAADPDLADLELADLELADLELAVRQRAGRPWPARTYVVDGCGIRLRRTPGPPGAPPAVYVHGLGGDATNFTDLAAALAGRLDGDAVDLPGFGGSDPAPGGDYSPAGQAGLLARLVERRGRGPVHLVGNSFGGVVCLLLAADRPDLVRTLTLISPAMPTLRPPAGPARQMRGLVLPGAGWLLARRMARLTPRQRVHALAAACLGDPTAAPDHLLAQAAEEIGQRDRLPWAVPALVGSVRGLAAAYLSGLPGLPGRPGGGRSLWRLAARVTAPTLVVWGGRDRLCDVALAPRTAAAIAGARLLVLPDAGHVGQMEDPTAVARALLGLLDPAAATPSPATDCERLTR